MADNFFPVPVRVRYAETDQMGVVHHSVYPVWFEAARTELSRALGLPYREWERDGILLMVTDLTCRYRHAATYDDEVIVGVRVAEIASRRVVFAYRVARADGVALALGETRHLVVSRATGHPTALPAPMRAALERDPATARPGQRAPARRGVGSRPRTANTRSLKSPTHSRRGRAKVTGMS